ncbi:MAG: DUF3488 domain-containing protein [Actinobacteria bacterium]|nr:DUF3488 domain-containing protein [Actinomycetota bacterium]MBU2688037.1 DUF3488 domain-containing protein [Actinomycetota bacterium]
MFERAVERYRLINRPGIAEESVPFRVAVLITVLISVAAAVAYGGVGAAQGAFIIVGIVIGFYYSYRVRHRSNVLMKFILSVLLLVVFALFWTELGGSVHDLRYPLVRLFLWLQVLHSFDLPTRRDLDFSIVSAAILIAFAGSLSISNDFLYFLVPFFIAGLTALYLGHRSDLKGNSDVYIPAGRRRWPVRGFTVAGLVMVPVTLVFFMALPRLPGFNSNYLPVSGSENRPASFDENVVRNPGYGQIPEKFPERPLPFNPDAYWGFNNYLDLRVRGVPRDVTVMKVRSSEPSYWRSTAFDRYIGNGWENTDKTLEEINSNQLPLNIGYPGEPPRYAYRELVQTFFVERLLPNTLFAAYLPRDVFFPTRVLKVDRLFTVLTPVALDPGLVYTVVSDVSTATPEALRSAHGRGFYPKGMKEQYTQLPEMSPRVAELALEVTKDQVTDYDKVQALLEYLQKTYPYDLDTPKQADGENTVEFFLFDEKRGYCEHFATALAVMCRTQGIPTRLAVGFDSGDFNPLTGYYEVSMRDAHAWVEVYFPIFGWISFDPTPGWSSPQALPTQDTTWSGFTMLRRLGRAIAGVFPDSWGNALKAGFRGVGDALGAAAAAILRFWPLALLAALLVAGGYYLAGRKRHRSSRAGPDEGEPADPRMKAAALFSRMSDALAGAGLARAPAQTPREYALFVDHALGGTMAGSAAALFNRAFFGADPTDAVLADLETAVEEVINSWCQAH